MPFYSDDIDQYIGRQYFGRILHGRYTAGLKKRVKDYIAGTLAFEHTGNPAIPYIAAWEENSRNIWYEFAGRRFLKLMNCEGPELAAVLRNSIIDQRIYKYEKLDAAIQKKIFDRRELSGTRQAFREKGKILGVVDAVYKISLEKNQDIWLKDLAKIETCTADHINLSLGCLTLVTKEMRAEEERLKREQLQVSLQMAGAVCHELNQPLQAISGYAEILLMNLPRYEAVYPKVEKIIGLAKKMGAITNKLMKITRYETKDYVKGVKIIDIEKSSAGKTDNAGVK